MASLTNIRSTGNNANPGPNSTLLHASFSGSPRQMEFASQSSFADVNSSSLSCFGNNTLPEFHLPPNKEHPMLPTAVWQSSGIRGWGTGLDQDLAFSSSLASMIPASVSPFPNQLKSTRYIVPEKASLGEFDSKLDGSIRKEASMETMDLGNNWSTTAAAASSVNFPFDPSKGVDIPIQGVNLSASHSLANFPSDPGFAERGATFSFFNGDQIRLEVGKIFPSTEGSKAHPPMSVSRQSEKGPMNKLTRARSFRISAPSSPSTAATVELNFTAKSKIADSTIEAKAPGVIAEQSSELTRLKPDASTNELDKMDQGTRGQEVSCSSDHGLCKTGPPLENISPGIRKRKADKNRHMASTIDTNSAGKDFQKTDAAFEERKEKRLKSGEVMKEKDDEENKAEAHQSNSGNSGELTPVSLKESPKPAEPPNQDYIHVRARRGQATDSHSLAERIRREKISERMKFLQELVPGCSKVTGKAVMLDEIINYVQSLQRQVEFLSMKLAAVNPRLDLNIDNFLMKEGMQPRGTGPTMTIPPEKTNTYLFNYSHQVPILQVAGSRGSDVHSVGVSGRNLLASPSLSSKEAYAEALSQQLSQAWGDDLQSIVQMGFGQAPATSHCLSGGLPGHYNEMEIQ